MSALPGPWYRIQAVPAPEQAPSAEWDFMTVLPAVLSAVQQQRSFVVGWLSRGGGAPLELITNAGPPADGGAPAEGGAPGGGLTGGQRPEPLRACRGGCGLLFPNGARGVAIGDDWLRHAERMTWTRCPGRPAPQLVRPQQAPGRAGLFEATLVNLMERPFGWFVVADACPEELIDSEIRSLHYDLQMLRRGEDEQGGLALERAVQRLAELDAFREAGLWNVRVLAGASSGPELERIAPVLVGSMDLSHHPYRLRSGRRTMRWAQALGLAPEDGTGERPGGRHGRSRPTASGLTPGRTPSEGFPPGLAPGLTPDPSAGLGPGRSLDRFRAPGAPVAGRGRSDAGADRLSTVGTDAELQFPFVATAGTLAALAGLPRREVPGLRVLDAGYFDVTAETDDREPGTEVRTKQRIELGAILDGQDRTVGTFTIPTSTLNRHVFVTGATGAGKSQTVRHLLEELTRAGIPWLAIEPAKSEYATMSGRIERFGGPVTIVNPSDPRAVPLSVNPLAPEPGYPVQAHIDMVRALFQAAFDSVEPFPQIMAQALQRVYENNGWDVVTGGVVPGSLVEPAVPTLKQLQDAALQVINDVGYGPEMMADVKGFVDVRIKSLRIGSAGRFFEGGHPADIGGMLRENVVLAIEDVANDEDKAFLMGTLIIRIVEHLRMRARHEHQAPAPATPATSTASASAAAPDPVSGGLRHVIVIEEAHRLLRNRGSERASSHAVELFAGMLAEIRAYGEGIVVAEQIPTKLVPDVIKNTALKIVHRLPAFDDRHQVGAAMNLDEDQSREVVSLQPGVAAVFADGMDRPLRVRVPLGEDRERQFPSPPPPIDGRRSPACGCECRSGRACSLYELREADLLAAHQDWAWLRVWADVLVLAHLVDRPLPAVPPELGKAWSRLSPRLRECMLATVLERCVGRRAWSLRSSFAPEALISVLAGLAREMLDEPGRHAGERPGPGWVIPQLRWLHEMDRIFPCEGEVPDKHSVAPPLDYPLPGLRTGRPGDVLVGHRLRALRRHRLSMDLPSNRPVACIAIAGEDEHDEFAADLTMVAIGLDGDEERLGQAAEAMRVSDWLQPVLNWPACLVMPFAPEHPDLDGGRRQHLDHDPDHGSDPLLSP